LYWWKAVLAFFFIQLQSFLKCLAFIILLQVSKLKLEVYLKILKYQTFIELYQSFFAIIANFFMLIKVYCTLYTVHCILYILLENS